MYNTAAASTRPGRARAAPIARTILCKTRRIVPSSTRAGVHVVATFTTMRPTVLIVVSSLFASPHRYVVSTTPAAATCVNGPESNLAPNLSCDPELRLPATPQCATAAECLTDLAVLFEQRNQVSGEYERFFDNQIVIDSTAETSSSSCIGCAMGRYSSSVGASSCIGCAVGRYSSSAGGSRCTECAVRHQPGSTAGASSSIDCGGVQTLLTLFSVICPEVVSLELDVCGPWLSCCLSAGVLCWLSCMVSRPADKRPTQSWCSGRLLHGPLQVAQRRLAFAVALLPRATTETSGLAELDLDVFMAVVSAIRVTPECPRYLALCEHVLKNPLACRKSYCLSESQPLTLAHPQRARYELRDFITRRGDIPGIAAAPRGDDIATWDACIAGPPGSPYADGLFFLQVQLPTNYPMSPPKIQFVTRIYHCNVRPADGHIDVDVLGHAWCPAFRISTLLLCIQSLLSDPNPEAGCCAVIGLEEVGELCRTDRDKYDATARDWTHKFAALYG